MAKYVDSKWDGSKSRFSIEQLSRAVPAAVRAWAKKKAADAGGDVTKGDLKLPYKEPDGTINLAGCRAALPRIDGSSLPAAVKAKARAEIEAALAAGKKALGLGESEFRESYDLGVPFAEAKVEGNVIHNVALLGRVSSNNRTYSDQAMKDALRLYEGAPVYVDHPSEADLKSRGGVRSAFDLAGRIRNPRRVGEQIRGDVEVLDREPTKGLITSIASQMPEQAGMSHRAAGSLVAEDDGSETVTSLDRVFGVELVTEPATVKGLFESVWGELGEAVDGSDEDKRDALGDALRKRFAGWSDHLWIQATFSAEAKVVFRIWEGPYQGYWEVTYEEATDGSYTFGDPTKVRKVETFEPTESHAGDPANIEEDDEMEIKDLTLERLRSDRPDLIESITESVKAAIEKDGKTVALEAKVADLEAKVAEATEAKGAVEKRLEEAQLKLDRAAREEVVAKKLAEAKLPESAVTDRFRTSLVEAADEAAIDAEIEDRKKLVESFGKPSNRPLQPGSNRIEESIGGDEPTEQMTDEQFAEAASLVGS